MTQEQPREMPPIAPSALIWSKLAEPFGDDEVKFVAGAVSGDKTRALALAYIDARAVMARLDAVLTPSGWEDAYRIVDMAGGAVECALSLHFDHATITKCDVGYSDASEPSEVLKGAYSDAFKRAAVKFGVGRHLYAYPREWRPWDAQRKTWATTGSPPAAAQRANGHAPAREASAQPVPLLPASEGKAGNVSELLRWAHQEHELQPADVAKALGGRVMGDIARIVAEQYGGDYERAKTRVVLALAPVGD